MPKEKPAYDLESLKANIKRCENNIKLFQEAIAKEYENISELKKYVNDIEKIK